MERIGSETVALYADLHMRLEAYEAMRSIGHLQGNFTSKTINGITYHYFQTTLPDKRTQIYIGPDTPEIKQLIEDHRSETKNPDQLLMQRLASQIIAGGVSPMPTEMAKIIGRLADCGLFQVGGVLVGTIAFKVLGTHLGVLWESISHHTQDIDFATGRNIAFAVPDLKADVPAALESLQMGFFPVPRLSRSEPSTSYAIRGKTLQVDLLTTMIKGQTAPRFIHRLNAAAAPLKYIDYLIDNCCTAVLLAGTPCLVRVPKPAHYALHKLIISQERDLSSTAKKRKDLQQAHALLELLSSDRPGDIPIAFETLQKHGAGWIKLLRKGTADMLSNFGNNAILDELLRDV